MPNGRGQRVLVRNICRLRAEKPRVRGKAIMCASLRSGSQEEHGRIYYTPSEKAKQKGRPHQAYFERPVPEYPVLNKLAVFFSANAPHTGHLRNFLLMPMLECSVSSKSCVRSTLAHKSQELEKFSGRPQRPSPTVAGFFVPAPQSFLSEQEYPLPLRQAL